jgi:hypothetical protein
MSNIISHLVSIGVSMFIPISPNINWKNISSWSRTKQLFRTHFKQVHLSAISSDMGLHPLYFHKNLIGGSAILTFRMWASKISTSFADDSGQGIFSVSTLQGKGKKFISFISAYIAIQKGSEIGTESLYAQQTTLYEKAMSRNGNIPSKKFCPRINAILQLNNIIKNLQQQNHAIILMLDANQSFLECHKGKAIKPYSIEWLRVQRGMEDPFIKLKNSRPNSTTIIPNRDIDYVLSYGIDVLNISMLHQNIPCHSDHLGIVLDIDLNKYFSSTYSKISTVPPRLLTLGNLKSIRSYIKSVTEQVEHHKLEDKVNSLVEKALQQPEAFILEDAESLNKIDSQLTEIMLSAERTYSQRCIQRQYWSPTQREVVRTFSYWKQKDIMASKRSINWDHLNRLQRYTSISEGDHSSLDPVLITQRKRETRSKWKACKKQSALIHHQFLVECAEYMANKMRTTEEKALRAIIHVEASKRSYKNIKEIFGKQQVPLTQVDVLSDPTDPNSPHTTLTAREDIEYNILHRNRKHSLQSLSTPFMSHPELCHTIDPSSPYNQFDNLLHGSLNEDVDLQASFPDNENKWIEALHKCVSTEISLSLSCKDFRHFSE